jgi:hypothetical protein
MIPSEIGPIENGPYLVHFPDRRGKPSGGEFRTGRKVPPSLETLDSIVAPFLD